MMSMLRAIEGFFCSGPPEGMRFFGVRGTFVACIEQRSFLLGRINGRKG
jgi:hypothetical protein